MYIESPCLCMIPQILHSSCQHLFFNRRDRYCPTSNNTSLSPPLPSPFFLHPPIYKSVYDFCYVHIRPVRLFSFLLCLSSVPCLARMLLPAKGGTKPRAATLMVPSSLNMTKTAPPQFNPSGLDIASAEWGKKLPNLAANMKSLLVLINAPVPVRQYVMK